MSQNNFSTVSNLVSESLLRNGIDVDPTKATLAMTSRIGLLAAFCGEKFAGNATSGRAGSPGINNNNNNNSAAGGTMATLNPIEQRELRQILGDVGVALFAVANATNLDLGECVMQSLGQAAVPPQQQQQPAYSLPPQQQQQQQFMPQQQQPSAYQPFQRSTQQQQPQQQQSHNLPPVWSSHANPSPPHSTQPSSPALQQPAQNYGGGYNNNNNSSNNNTNQPPSSWQPQQQGNTNYYGGNNNNNNNINNNNNGDGVNTDISLNPNSSLENIKNFITAIRSQARPLSDDEFTRVGLMFAFRSPLHNGQIVSLVHNGERTPVRAHNFEEFCKLFFDQVARWESSPSGTQQQQQTNSSANNSAARGGYRPLPLTRSAFDDANNNNEVAGASSANLMSPGLGPARSPSTNNNNAAVDFNNGRRLSEDSNSNASNQQTSALTPQQLAQMQGAQVVGRDDNGDIILRLKVDTTGHPNLQQEMQSYSPSHFNQGLFSPKAEGAEIDVLYHQGTPPTDRQSLGGGGGGTTNSATRYQQYQQQYQQQGQQQGQAAQVPLSDNLQDPTGQLFASRQNSNTNTNVTNATSMANNSNTAAMKSFPPLDPAEVASRDALFAPRFTHLERLVLDVEDQLALQGKTANQIRQLLSACLPRDEIAALSLTFALPFKERIFELIDAGQTVAVTAMTAKEFVQLVRDQRAIFDGRLNKKPSIRVMAAPLPHGGDTGRMAGGFVTGSSTRPEMAAPADSRMTFSIDLDDAGKLIPEALAPKPVPAVIPTVSHYVAFISQHPEQFPDMFQQMKRKPESLARWNVAWIVPDPNSPPPSNQQHMTDHNARRCGVRELIPNGASITVRETEMERYTQLVYAASQDLPACLRPFAN